MQSKSSSIIIGTPTSSPKGLSFKACVVTGAKTPTALTIQDYSDLPWDTLKQYKQSSYNALILNGDGRLKTSLEKLKELDYESHGLEKPSTVFFVDPNATYKQEHLQFNDLYSATISEPLASLHEHIDSLCLTIKIIGANIAKVFAGLYIPEVKPGQDLTSIDIGSQKFTVTRGKEVNAEKSNFNQGVDNYNLYDRSFDTDVFKHIDGFISLLPQAATNWGELLSPTNEKSGLYAITKRFINLLNKDRQDTLTKLAKIVGEKSDLIRNLKQSTPDTTIKTSEIGSNGDRYGISQILDSKTGNVVFQAVQVVVAKLLATIIKSLGIKGGHFLIQSDQLTNILSNQENQKIFLEEFEEGSQLSKLNDNPQAPENIYNGAAIMSKAYIQNLHTVA